MTADDDVDRVLAAAHRCPDPEFVADHALGAARLGAADAQILAVAFGFAAATRLRRTFDNDHAGAILDEALAIWTQLPPELATRFDASTAWRTLGDLRGAVGEEQEAIRAYRRAIVAARTPDDIAAVYIAWYWLPYRHGDFGACLAILEEGLELLPIDAAVPRAHVQREIGWLLLRSRRAGEGGQVLRQALAVLEAAGDRAGVMMTLDGLGCAEWANGRIDSSIGLLERCLAIALESGDALYEAAARMHLIRALVARGRLGVARRHAERSQELCRQMGDRYLESVTEWLTAEMEDAAGHPDAAVARRRRQLILLEELGGNPRNEAWAHAHLAVLARETGDRAAEARETAAARGIAGRSPMADDADWIERALVASRWAEVRIS